MDHDAFERLKAEIDRLENAAELTMTGVYLLPRVLTRLLGWMTRQKGASAEAIAEHLDADLEPMRELLAELVQKSFITQSDQEGTTMYQVLLTRPKKKKDSKTDIWKKLDL